MGFQIKTKPNFPDKTQIDESVNRSMYALAVIFVKRLQWNIRHRGIDLLPKSPGWQKRSPDTRPLIHMGDYVRSFKALKLPKGAAVLGDEKMAAIHEFGAPSAHVPARPHLGPTIRQINKEIAEEFGVRIIATLNGRKL